MGPEFWVGLAAVFVSGGAVGAAGVLLSQWLVRKLGSDAGAVTSPIDARELRMLQAEMADMTLRLQNLDARLDFQEQLLGGATPLVQPPARLPAADPSGQD